MANSSHDEISAGSGYAAQLETLRSAARWLVAALAGVAALLVAGLQLAGISRLPLDSWRLYVALGAASAALISIGFMIKQASMVLTQEWLTLADFTDEATGLPDPWGRRKEASAYLRRIEDHLIGSRHELFGYAAPTLGELHSGLHACHTEMWLENLDAADRRLTADRSAVLRRAARDVVQAANYYYVMILFRELRRRMAWAAVVGIAGIAIFAYIIPPEAHSPVDVRIVSTRPIG